MLEYPARVWARRVRREPSVRVSSPPVMGRMPRLLARRGELQGPTEVGVGEGEGGIAVLSGPGQQLVKVGCSLPKGIKAFGVEFHVFDGHPAPCRVPVTVPAVTEDGDAPTVAGVDAVVGAADG